MALVCSDVRTGEDPKNSLIAKIGAVALFVKSEYIEYMTLAEWIEAEGMTRADAAQRLGLSPSYLTELCQRKRTPSVTVAIRIAETSKGKISFRDLLASAA